MNRGAGPTVAGGILEGFSVTQSILDGIDRRKRGKVIAQREDEEYSYNKKRREIEDGRRDEQYAVDKKRSEEIHSMRVTDHASSQALRALNIEQAKAEWKEYQGNAGHRERLKGLETRTAELGLQGAELKAKAAKQEQLMTEIRPIYDTAVTTFQQAAEALEAGDSETANRLYEMAIKDIDVIGDAGFPIEHFKKHGGSKIKEFGNTVIQHMQQGTLDQLDPKTAKEMSKLIFEPIMHATGRADRGLEFIGMQPTGRKDEQGQPTFTPLMKTKDGKTVPATQLMSDHDNDELIELPMNAIMSQMSQVASVGDEYAKMKQLGQQLERTGARLGANASPEDKNLRLEREKQKNRLTNDAAQRAHEIDKIERNAALDAEDRLYDPDASDEGREAAALSKLGDEIGRNLSTTKAQAGFNKWKERTGVDGSDPQTLQDYGNYLDTQDTIKKGNKILTDHLGDQKITDEERDGILGNLPEGLEDEQLSEHIQSQVSSITEANATRNNNSVTAVKAKSAKKIFNDGGSVTSSALLKKLQKHARKNKGFNTYEQRDEIIQLMAEYLKTEGATEDGARKLAEDEIAKRTQ